MNTAVRRRETPQLREAAAAGTAPRPSAPLDDLLLQMLRAMGWRRSDAVFASALPDGGLVFLDDAAVVLALLEYSSTVEPGVPQGWRDGLDGALITLSKDGPCGLVRINGVETPLVGSQSDAGRVRRAITSANRILYVRHLGVTDTTVLQTQVFRRQIRRTLRAGFGLSFLINAFAVLIPIFSTAVFDRVIGGHAPRSLLPLISGAAVVVVCLVLLRWVRTRLLAGQYARLAAMLGMTARFRLLRSPLGSLHRQSTERLDARVESVRRAASLFSSANAPAVFDAPFIVISIVVIGFIGGILVVVPAVYLLIFLALAVVLSHRLSQSDPELARAGQERVSLLRELSNDAAEIRDTGMSPVWLTRFADIARLSARGAHVSAVRQAGLQSVGTILGTGAALATLAVGVDLAISGVITSGALVGTMLLTWRVTGPAQALFLGLPRIRAAMTAIQQLEQSLSIPTMTGPAVALEQMPVEPPAVECAACYYRYEGQVDAALASVSFKVLPGTVNVILGPNGAGKTTLLRLLVGALTPQSGSVLINGVTLRQMDPDEVALNSLALPALGAFGMPEGHVGPGSPGRWDPAGMIDTVVNSVLASEDAEAGPARYPDGSARVPRYILLDDPVASADAETRDQFLAYLAAVRGEATVFFATHDTSLVTAADNALVLNRGAIAYFGPVERGATSPQPLRKVPDL